MNLYFYEVCNSHSTIRCPPRKVYFLCLGSIFLRNFEDEKVCAIFFSTPESSKASKDVHIGNTDKMQKFIFNLNTIIGKIYIRRLIRKIYNLQELKYFTSLYIYAIKIYLLINFFSISLYNWFSGFVKFKIIYSNMIVLL